MNLRTGTKVQPSIAPVYNTLQHRSVPVLVKVFSGNIFLGLPREHGAAPHAMISVSATHRLHRYAEE
jgi:hypothetical protein